MNVRGSTRTAEHGPFSTRAGIGLGAVLYAAGAFAAQIAVLALVPPDWQIITSALMTASALIVLTAILVRVRPNPRPQRGATPPYESFDADAPSPQMRMAYRLARRGVPAVWIAEHCDLPPALAELVVADALSEADGPEGRAPFDPDA